MKKRILAIVSGRVQGVLFRYFTREKAKELGLVGTVRNLSDGTVEVIAEGDEGSLKELVKWLWKGPVLAKVKKVEVIWADAMEEFEDFKIIYSSFWDRF